MQFLSVSRRRTEQFADAEFAARGPAEAEQVRSLYAQGSLRQVWLRGDMPGACMLWEADSKEQVTELLGTLPLFQAGMLEIIAVFPLKPYPGFGPRT
jgi:muconolactone delta-isomerase